MGKTLKYVDEFDFGPQKTYVKAYARGGKACGCNKAAGGDVIAKPANQGVANKPPATKGIGAMKPPMLKKPAQKVAFAKGGAAHDDEAQDRAMIREAVHKHERKDHPGTSLTKLKKGGVFEKATGERYPTRAAMVKHESMETPTEQRDEVVRKSLTKGLPARRSVPVAPTSPLLAMKQGGVPKAGAFKVPKVMNEFKAGELHSGSKSGPVVKNRKQAIAIALSEARKAGKK